MGRAVNKYAHKIADAVFTKEDAEIFESLLNENIQDAEMKFFEYIKNNATDDKITALLNFINYRKTSTQRLAHKQLILETSLKEIELIYEKMDEVIKGASQIATPLLDYNTLNAATLATQLVFRGAVLTTYAGIYIDLVARLNDRVVRFEAFQDRELLLY